MTNYDNKRNFYRMMLNSEVTLTIIDDESNSKALVTCRDLSATGMAIEMQHPLEINTAVRISVQSLNNAVQHLNAIGKVVRVTEDNANCYLIGVNITEVD
ncbi:PilZ domain-containing protein [Colwellia sp. MB02u-6]|jgi:c-di-GMP-binding flagellar brake protein YcgR|uniref:PilZ domain-containing protein n=1 Tax=Colwellia sp. MB02u-6 TaxID=2759824 RepID=UPI0015F58AD8|nr:PilZ domain-containing protein [Colwellia sp. MB02u-6]MBA6326488.1 PilZ domain-containing protein [Colwellia sp. MB02u-6]